MHGGSPEVSKSETANVIQNSLDDARPTMSAEKNATQMEADEVSMLSFQRGLQKSANLRQNMTTKRWALVYLVLILTIFASRFVVYTALIYNAYATSAFSQHSLLSAAGVVNDITQLCAYPIIAKLGDVIGRAEAFGISISVLALSQVLFAASPNIETYIVAGIFNAIGDTGLLLTEQVFIAETTTLAARGFWAALPESVTGIVALYVGSIIADAVLSDSTWRWGYGMWAIVLIASGLPLVVVTFIFEHRGLASNQSESDPHASKGAKLNFRKSLRFVWYELDILGAALLVAGLALILIPVSLTGSSHSEKWHSWSFIFMLVLGCVILVAFGIWDGKWAQKPIVSYRMMKNRTVTAACLLGAFDFLGYSTFTIFFPSYLQVIPRYSPGHASRVSNALIVTYQATRILTGILLRVTKRPYPFIVAGIPLVILGQGLLIRFSGSQAANEASYVVAKVLMGVGRGIYHTAALVVLQAVVPQQQLAVATAVFLAMMTFGSAIGQSIGGAIWRSTLLSNLEQNLPSDSKSQANKIFGSLAVARSYDPGSPIRNAIDQSYGQSMVLLAIVATAVLAPMLILVFFVRRIDLKTTEKSNDAKASDHP